MMVVLQLAALLLKVIAGGSVRGIVSKEECLRAIIETQKWSHNLSDTRMVLSQENRAKSSEREESSQQYGKDRDHHPRLLMLIVPQKFVARSIKCTISALREAGLGLNMAAHLESPHIVWVTGRLRQLYACISKKKHFF